MFKSTSAILFHVFLQVHDVLFDRKVIKCQTTTGAMTLVYMAEVPSNWEKRSIDDYAKDGGAGVVWTFMQVLP